MERMRSASLRTCLWVTLSVLGPALGPAAARDDDVSLRLPTPSPVLDAIVEEGLRDSQVMELLDELVNGIGPRLTGSENLTRAGEWAVSRLEALGLDARLERWGEMAVGFERGPSRGAMVAPDVMELTFITPAWTAGTEGAVRGPAVMEPTTADELERNRSALAGAWVLVPRQDDGQRLDQDFLAERRAVYDEVDIAGTVRASPSGELLVMRGNPRITWDDLPDSVSITILESQFDAIAARIRAGETVELEFDIDNRFIEGPVPQYNVVADLVGEVQPDEYVVVGGHLDSWDAATGTNDNGTGVATTLEAARLLVEAGARPGRTIRFMLWGGEEQGLRGSRAWVAANADPVERTSAVLNHDGGTNALAGITVTRAMHPQILRAFAPVLDYSREVDGAKPFEIEVVSGLAFGASDHNAFLEQRVPGFSWRQRGDAIYSQTHHTHLDTFETASAEDLRHSSVVVALAALGLADLPELLDRTGLVRVRRRFGVQLGADGLTVTRVVPDSHAARAGMAAGDRLLSMNGRALKGAGLRKRRDAGEGRKLVSWQHGDEVRRHVFEWDEGHVDRDPERVTLKTEDGVDLVADYFMGRVDGPAAGAAVVLLPESHRDRHAWIPVRASLYRAGIATLALDPRGRGESDDESEIDSTEPAVGNFSGLLHDLAAAVSWLETRAYAAERIGIMTAGDGTNAALATAWQGRLGAVAALTPDAPDDGGPAPVWDGRPLVLVSGRDGPSAEAWLDALRARDPWTAAQHVVLETTNARGTRLLGDAPDVEQRLADWWSRALRR